MSYWYTPEQAAEELAVSVRTIKRRIGDGTLPAYRIGKLLRIKASDLAQVGERV
jgi:excisionase family DNA binding protein